MNSLILASASPRRRELLEQIGVRFDQAPVDIDESVLESETPQAYVARLALEKAEAGFERGDGRPVLGSDTTVVLGSEILGKPVDLGDVRKMLRKLSGSTHQVLTAIALATVDTTYSRMVTTEVEFREISDAEIEHYWLSGEPKDKAGSYGIQGLGAVFVKRIAGSYSAVVGLPLAETSELLSQAGVPIWQSSADKEC